MNRLIGSRVMLKKGMSEEGYKDVMMWCAGTVPVGAIGTLAKTKDSAHGLFHVEWDDYEAKEGYKYGFMPNDIEDCLEFIEEE